MHDQILVIKLPAIETKYFFAGFISILPKTDVSKTSVRISLQCTGAELFDFLVLENFWLKWLTTNEMNLINLLYKLWVKFFNIS